MTAASIVVKHCVTVGVLTDTIYFCANHHSEGPSQTLKLYPPSCSEAPSWISPLFHIPGEILINLSLILTTYSFTITFQEDKGPCDWGSVELVKEYENPLNIQRTKDLQLFVQLNFVMGSSLLGICLCRCMFGRKTASLSGNAVSKAFLKLTEHPSHQSVELNLRTAQMSDVQKKKEKIPRSEVQMWNQLYIKSDFWGATQGRQKDVVDMSNLLADSFFIYTSGKKPQNNFPFGVELQASW